MQLFKSLYNEGPGVDKNEPKKKGITLFWWIIKNNFFRLILLNLFFLLCCLPIVTIGPSLKALSKVTMDMARMQPTSPISDFISEFKEDFWKSVIIGLVIIIIVTAALAFYFLPGQTEQGQYFLTAIVSIVLLIVLAVSMYIFKSLGTINLPIKTIIKNAILLVLVSIKSLMLIFICVCIPTFFLISNIIYGLPFLLLWQFAFNSVITSVISWGVINKYIVLKNEDQLETALEQ